MAPAERIRDLNDKLRTTGIGGTTYLTRGMWAKGSDFVAKACAAVRAFDAFTEDNDPWQEHDCATLDVDGETRHLQDRLLRPEHGVWLARPRRPQRHAARPHHHARGRILVSSTGTPAPHCPGARWGVIPPSPSIHPEATCI